MKWYPTRRELQIWEKTLISVGFFNECFCAKERQDKRKHGAANDIIFIASASPGVSCAEKGARSGQKQQ